MSEFSLWLHQAGARMSAGLRSFMSGRYGSDRLNMAILCAGLIASIFSSLFRDLTVRMIFLVLSYALMFWAIYRALSRNTYKRYQENRKFLLIFDRLKEQPLFQLSQVPPDRPGSPGEGQNLHHLPQMQGEVHPKDLNSIIFREPPQVPGFLFSAGNSPFCLLTHICPF